MSALSTTNIPGRIDLVGGILNGGYEFLLGENRDRISYLTWQLTAANRELLVRGIVQFVPIRYSQIVATFGRDGPLPVDALVVHISPPDLEGWCSLGVAVSYCAPMLNEVPRVIGIMNRQMPRTAGDGAVHISRFERVLEVDEKLAEYPQARASTVDVQVAQNLASLINDGATLQVGLGGIPESLPSLLEDRRDLGLYGMLTDSGLDLIERGLATGTRYALRPGTFEVGEVMGSRRLFDYVDENPKVRVVSATYALEVSRMAQIEQFISINSAVEVDVTGQVNAESLGHLQISGAGGQLDYMEGAVRSRGGRAIVALPSITSSGKSRIVCHLAEGSVVTTPRTAVTHVVTEYGVADLRGKNLLERAEQLIAIAHPSVRDGLREDAVTHRFSPSPVSS
jgi:acyl-CoA hydrolase